MLDALQKRALERDLRASGLSRRQAKTAVSRVAAAVARGELRPGGGHMAAVVTWLKRGMLGAKREVNVG